VPDDVTLSLSDEDRELADRLDDEIYAFNVEATGLADGRMLTIRAVDPSGALVAGLSGWTWGGCAYVDVLWVRADLRHQGVGTRLLDAAEQEAVARGCTQIVLSTHTFQAPDFYRARGYVETGRTPDYPVGHAQLHLSRQLTVPGGSRAEGR
jgi:GNAT superfamily N-acetyltransferase